MKALPDIRRATAELVRVRGELRRVESRIDVICGTLREAIADSFGSDLESPFLASSRGNMQESPMRLVPGSRSYRSKHLDVAFLTKDRSGQSAWSEPAAA